MNIPISTNTLRSLIPTIRTSVRPRTLSWVFLYLLIALTGQVHAQITGGRIGNGNGTGFPGFTGTQSQTGISGSKSGGRGGIDDSTKVIYGPKTTRYFLETDIFNNRKTLYLIDTALAGHHQYNFVNRNQNLYQDLGNLGTALRPVFYEEQQQIGAQNGFYAYAPYAFQTMQVKYYDTKSPFTRMYFVLGGRNQNVLNFDFSQNINARWNAGFQVQRVTSRKQFGVNQTVDPSSFLAQGWAFVGQTSYRSKNDKYTLLAHFNHLNHEIEEQGGVLPLRSSGGELLGYTFDGSAKLTNAKGFDRRNMWHLYQQYIMAPGLQVYHRLDYQRTINTFYDTALAKDSALTSYYPAVVPALFPAARRAQLDSATTHQDIFYRLLENNVGLKGIYQIGKSAFNYRAYMRHRIYSQTGEYNRLAVKGDSVFTGTYRNPTRLIDRNELFLGLWLGYYFPDSLSRLTVEGEYLIGRDIRLEGQLETKLFTAGYRSIFVSPTLLQQRFESNNLTWSTNFGLRGTQHAYGKLNLAYRKIRFQPGLDYYLLNNYIYFDENALPKQLSSAFSILRAGVGAQVSIGKFQASTQGYYTVVSRNDILRAPKLFVNLRASYDLLFAKVLYIQTGVELHYKSAYYADNYMPLTQQFYLQNNRRVEGYVLADVFANFRINRTRLFVKMSHVNQDLLQPTYFVGADYLGMRRTFAFGVDWYLFD